MILQVKNEEFFRRGLDLLVEPPDTRQTARDVPMTASIASMQKGASRQPFLDVDLLFIVSLLYAKRLTYFQRMVVVAKNLCEDVQAPIAGIMS